MAVSIGRAHVESIISNSMDQLNCIYKHNFTTIMLINYPTNPHHCMQY